MRILQFGEGNFLRAFVDWMIDKANEAGVMHHGVVIVQPILPEDEAGRNLFIPDPDNGGQFADPEGAGGYLSRNRCY